MVTLPEYFKIQFWSSTLLISKRYRHQKYVMLFHIAITLYAILIQTTGNTEKHK